MMPSEVVKLTVQRDLIDGSLFVLATDANTGEPMGAFETVELADLELGALYDFEFDDTFKIYNDDDLRASQAETRGL